MKKRISHDIFKKELLSDPEVKEIYDEFEEEYQLMSEMLYARKRAHMNQDAVAKAMKTTTSVVSRLENMGIKGRPSPSFSTLKKYAHALGCRLVIKLVPEEK